MGHSKECMVNCPIVSGYSLLDECLFVRDVLAKLFLHYVCLYYITQQ